MLREILDAEIQMQPARHKSGHQYSMRMRRAALRIDLLRSWRRESGKADHELAGSLEVLLATHGTVPTADSERSNVILRGLVR
jgi:hypothetical protein